MTQVFVGAASMIVISVGFAWMLVKGFKDGK